MKPFYRKLGCILLMFVNGTLLYAQSSFTSAGGTFESSTGTVDYSIGQLFYHRVEGPPGTILEGVQQPYEIYDITDIEDPENSVGWVNVYPNPTEDYLNLNVNTLGFYPLYYQFYDTRGTLLFEQSLTEVDNRIDTREYAVGIYLLKIFSGNKVIKTYKIIKNK